MPLIFNTSYACFDKYSVQVDTADNSALANIISEVANIEYNSGRKKRSANRGRQSSGTVMANNLVVASNNMVADVIINLKTLLGSTQIDNYYYYDVS